jgi:two-component system, NarL family, response regulator LiaR
MATDKIRVLIVDDDPGLRQALAAGLAGEEGIHVTGQAGDGAEALAQAEELSPDVVLMDLGMPMMDGIEATRRITQEVPCVAVLAMTASTADTQIFQAIKAGALAFLLKDCAAAEVADAIRCVFREQLALDVETAGSLLNDMAHPAPGVPPTRDPLTEREYEVVQLAAEGLNNVQIAARLSIAEVLVGMAVGNILGKLHVAFRTGTALYARREGPDGAEVPA